MKRTFYENLNVKLADNICLFDKELLILIKAPMLLFNNMTIITIVHRHYHNHHDHDDDHQADLVLKLILLRDVFLHIKMKRTFYI